MVKRKVPNVVRGGVAVPLGRNYYYMSGRKHETGGIDIGENPRTGLEVEDGEVVHVGNKNLKVFSAQPIIGGQSPAQRVMQGENPNDVFNAQERYKKVNNINDDGTRKKRRGGTAHVSNNKKLINETYKNQYGRYPTDAEAAQYAILAEKKNEKRMGGIKGKKRGIYSLTIDGNTSLHLYPSTGSETYSITKSSEFSLGGVRKRADIGTEKSLALYDEEVARRYAKKKNDKEKREYHIGKNAVEKVYNPYYKQEQGARIGSDALYNVIGGDIARDRFVDKKDPFVRDVYVGYNTVMDDAREKFNKPTMNDVISLLNAGMIASQYYPTRFSAWGEPLDVSNVKSPLNDSSNNSDVNNSSINNSESNSNNTNSSDNDTNTNLTNVNGSKTNNSKTRTPKLSQELNLVSMGSLDVDNTAPTIEARLPSDSELRSSIRNTIDNYNNVAAQYANRNRSFGDRLSKFFSTKLSGDEIGLGANAIASLIGWGLNRNYLNRMKYASEPINMSAAKLKTRININPQLNKMRENLANYEKSVRANTGSSQVALARQQQARLNTLMNMNEAYANKENQETALINQDRLNQQQVRNANIQAYNAWAQGKAAFDNTILEKKSENAVSLVNNLNAGIQNLITNKQKRASENKTIAAMSLASPNLPAEMYLASGIWTKEMYERYRKAYPLKK